MSGLLLACILLCHLPQTLQSPQQQVNKADTSLGILILVNKQYALPANYLPQNLVKLPNKYSTGELMKLQAPAEEAFRALVNAARKDGHWIHNRSGFRTEAIQKMLYTQNVEKYGEELANQKSARPGQSEHQTGLAVDVNHVHRDFAHTKVYAWLQEHAHLYGFILRYPEGKESITGYQYEPWHYRYVGVEVATFIHKNHLTFEEYYQTYIEP